MSARILVVDDSEMVRELHGFALRGAGYEVDDAENGSAAIEKLLSHHFDLVITDVNMPQMDGYELTRRIRTTDGYQDTPVILVSTESQALDKSIGFEAGANVYLVKPAKAEDLVINAQMLTEHE